MNFVREYQAAVALGANLGDRQRTLQGAVCQLAATTEVEVIAHSALYQTAPMGPSQPEYLNACILLKTTLYPEAILSRLLAIEEQFGRVRSIRWGPRTLDLDLLLYEQWVYQSPRLVLPHPRMLERAFVMQPLGTIAPNWIHPVTQKQLSQFPHLPENNTVVLYAETWL